MAEEYVGRKFDTSFVGSARADSKRVQEICDAGKTLNELGLTPDNAGNISVRSKGGMLITVGGVNKGELTVDDVVEVVNFDFQTAKVVGRKEPSSETPMHWLIYQSFPMANAVIHAHDDLAVKSSDRLKLALGVHSTKEKTLYGSEDQAYQVIEALKHVQYAVIREHGVVCIGESLEEALCLISKIHHTL